MTFWQRLFLLLCLLTSCTGPPTPPTLAEIASGQVEVVDLGYALNEQNPYWPGEGYSPFHFEVLSTLEADGVYTRVHFPRRNTWEPTWMHRITLKRDNRRLTK